MSRSSKSTGTSFPRLDKGQEVRISMGMDCMAKASVLESHSHKCIVKLSRSGKVLTLTDASFLKI